MIIPLSSAIRGSQHSYIEDPNYFRTQNVPGLHTLMNARKTYHIYIHNYPNFACTKITLAYIHNYPISACTKITPGLHTQLPQFCMYAKHFFRTRGNSACKHMALGGSGAACTKNIPHLHTWTKVALQ